LVVARSEEADVVADVHVGVSTVASWLSLRRVVVVAVMRAVIELSVCTDVVVVAGVDGPGDVAPWV